MAPDTSLLKSQPRAPRSNPKRNPMQTYIFIFIFTCLRSSLNSKSLTPFRHWQIEMSHRLGFTLSNGKFMKMNSLDRQLAFFPFPPHHALDLPLVMAKLTLKGSCHKTSRKVTSCNSTLPFSVWRMIRESDGAARKIYGEALANLPPPLETGKSGKVLTGCLGFFSFFRWVTFTAIIYFCAVNLIMLKEF